MVMHAFLLLSMVCDLAILPADLDKDCSYAIFSGECFSLSHQSQNKVNTLSPAQEIDSVDHPRPRLLSIMLILPL